MKTVHIDLGLVPYKEAWDLQKSLHEKKKKTNCKDYIITCEHPHVYTLGKSGNKNHLLLNIDELKKKGIEYFEVDRGGDLTYHGPGQLVVYPIFDLNNYYLDIHRFLRDLEEAVILTLKEFAIDANHDEQFTGVWVGEEKICAIGINVSRWITMHGLALNVNTDLNYFNTIIPCGIFHKGITSFEKVLGKKIEMEDVKKIILEKFKLVFKIKNLLSEKTNRSI